MTNNLFFFLHKKADLQKLKYLLVYKNKKTRDTKIEDGFTKT